MSFLVLIKIVNMYKEINFRVYGKWFYLCVYGNFYCELFWLK